MPEEPCKERTSPDGRWLELRRAAPEGLFAGWAAARYLLPWTGDAFRGPRGQPPWLALAKREIGVREYPDETHNPRIVAHHATTALRATTDEVPWCSAFANWCMRRTGLRGDGLRRRGAPG
jgi:hypothetical protein